MLNKIKFFVSSVLRISGSGMEKSEPGKKISDFYIWRNRYFCTAYIEVRGKAYLLCEIGMFLEQSFQCFPPILMSLRAGGIELKKAL